MRKNRKVSKRMSRISMHTMHVGAVMLMLFVMVILNLLASSSCDQLMKRIDEKEKVLRLREADLDNAMSRWDLMKSSDNLDRALIKFGLSMRIPQENQIVRMDAKGRPKAGQTSVALARQRANRALSAQVRPASRVRR